MISAPDLLPPAPAPDPANAVLQARKVVFGRYALERLVGRGGMGVVWLARDSRLERPVALKFLPDTLLLDPAARDDLKRETRRCLDLTHPHIVRIHDFAEDDEMAAIVMEYVDGPTLSQLRVAHPHRYFQPDEVGVWTAALCAALEYAHDAARCVHRDLKPGNLMVNGRGALKVADFGIACSLQHTAARVSAWSSTGGTLGYMSPQQLLGELAAPSDDIYSLGASLYELFTGKPPFFGGDLALQIREVVPDSITERRRKFGLPSPALDPAWEKTIADCLAKNPRQRPASAGEVARRLGLSCAPLAELAPALGDALPPTMCIAEPPRKSFVPPHWTLDRFLQWIAPLMRFRWPIVTSFAIAAAIVPWIIKPGRAASAPQPALPSQAPALPQASAPVPTAAAAPVPTVPSAPPASLLALAPAAIPTLAPTRAAQPPPASPTPPAPASEALATIIPASTPQPGAASAAAIPENSPPVRLETTPPGIPFQVFASAYETPISQVLRSGQTPAALDLPPGAYRVVFSPVGAAARTASIQVPKSGAAVLETFPHGTLKVHAQPEAAEIICDGREMGPGPLETELLPGRHEITARWAGREARMRTVEIADAGEQSVSFDFHTGSSSQSKSHHVKKKPDDSSMLTKISRTFKSIFTGEKSSAPPAK